jgi:hypothetical protein
VTIAYLLWHWKREAVSAVEYSVSQRTFHEAMATSVVHGYGRSESHAVSGLPWANRGRKAYEDWYHIADLSVLDTLDGAVVSGRRDPAHARAAGGAAGGAAGVYRPRLGAPLNAPSHVSWFNRPDGMGYPTLFALIEPHMVEGESVLWMRRLVLGPTEFCLQSTAPLKLPAPLTGLTVAYRKAW